MSSFADQWGAVGDAINSGAFDPQGMNYTPLYNPIPALPTTFAPPTAAGNVVTSKGSGASLAPIAPTLAKQGTDGVPNTPMMPAPAAATSAISPGGLADYFLRGVIIILGFIFVAVGLRMFAPAVVQAVTR